MVFHICMVDFQSSHRPRTELGCASYVAFWEIDGDLAFRRVPCSEGLALLAAPPTGALLLLSVTISFGVWVLTPF